MRENNENKILRSNRASRVGVSESIDAISLYVNV